MKGFVGVKDNEWSGNGLGRKRRKEAENRGSGESAKRRNGESALIMAGEGRDI
jgi:hypothetical protein